MARKRRGHGRRRGIQITPKRVVKALVVVAGGKMVLDSDVINLAKSHVNNPSQFTASNTPKIVIEYAKRIVPGAAVIAVGPKVVDKAVALLSKGEPMIGRLANAKIVKIGA